MDVAAVLDQFRSLGLIGLCLGSSAQRGALEAQPHV